MSKNIFKKKSYKTVRVGEWLYEWFINEKHPERSFMRIMDNHGKFELRLKPDFNAFGYLLASAEQELTMQLKNYATLLFQIAALDTLDQELDNDLWRAIDHWRERQMQKGAEQAAKVTPEQNEADTALLNDIISEQGLSKKELAEKRAEDRELLKEVLEEEEGEE